MCYEALLDSSLMSNFTQIKSKACLVLPKYDKSNRKQHLSALPVKPDDGCR